jgi:hypothetical protein
MHRLSLLHVGILTKAMAWLQLLKGSTVYLEPQVVFIYNAIDLKSAGAHYRLTTPSGSCNNNTLYFMDLCNILTILLMSDIDTCHLSILIT